MKFNMPLQGIPLIARLGVLLYSIVMILLILMPFGCSHKPDKATEFFKGNHELLALDNIMVKETSRSGWFAIVVGGYSSNENSDCKVRFSWKNNNGEYMPSERSLRNVRIVIDSTITIPYCKFRWYSSSEFEEYYWNDYVRYVVLVLKKEDIKSDIKLDLTK